MEQTAILQPIGRKKKNSIVLHFLSFDVAIAIKALFAKFKFKYAG